MTNEEKHQQKLYLLSEYGKAREDLAHLHEKATKMIKDIREVADRTEHVAFCERLPPDEDFPDELRYRVLKFEPHRDLVYDLRTAKRKIDDLDVRLISLGVHGFRGLRGVGED